MVQGGAAKTGSREIGSPRRVWGLNLGVPPGRIRLPGTLTCPLQGWPPLGPRHTPQPSLPGSPPQCLCFPFHSNPLQVDEAQGAPLRIRKCGGACEWRGSSLGRVSVRRRNGERMLGLQTWTNASVSTAAQDNGRKNNQNRRQQDKMPSDGSKRAPLRPLLPGGGRDAGCSSPAHGPHAAPVQQFQRSHADLTAAKSVMKTRTGGIVQGALRTHGFQVTAPHRASAPSLARARPAVGRLQPGDLSDPRQPPGGLQEAAWPPLTSHFTHPHPHTSLRVAQMQMNPETSQFTSGRSETSLCLSWTRSVPSRGQQEPGFSAERPCPSPSLAETAWD